MLQQAGLPLSPPQCCCGFNYHFFRSHEGYSPSRKQVLLPWWGWLREANLGRSHLYKPPRAACCTLPPPAVPQLCLREHCLALLGYKPSHTCNQAGDKLALSHAAGRADWTFRTQASLSFLAFKQGRKASSSPRSLPQWNPEGRWKIGRIKKKKLKKIFLPVPQDRQEMWADCGQTCQDRAVSCPALSQKSDSPFLNNQYPSFQPSKAITKTAITIKRMSTS